MAYTVTQLRLALPVPSFKNILPQGEKLSNYRLVTVDQRFIAETVARTGSEELLTKASRNFVGLYDENENWYIPLRANLNKKKSKGSYFETPFYNTNPHLKRPGLDFQKALYVSQNYIISISNTLPVLQGKVIEDNQEKIKESFEKYVLGVENLSKDSLAYQFSTVPLFPEGIQKIKEKFKEQQLIPDHRANILNENVGFIIHNERQEINQNTMKIYRGIIANDQKTADQWIKSTNTIQSTDFGRGIYWTQDSLVAMEYGNFIYSAEIKLEEAKKVLAAQEIVLLTSETHKALETSLEASLDCGIKAQYTFNSSDWRNSETKGKTWRSETFKQEEIEASIKKEVPIPEYLKPKEAPVQAEVPVNELIKNKDYKGLSQHLRTGIQDYLNSDNYKNYLNFISKFHKYSSRNNRLILLQNKEASRVAGFNKWKEMGRKVKQGSKALYVYAPGSTIKKDVEGKPILDEKGEAIKETYFFLTPVFDVSQTTGEPLPKQIYELENNLESPSRFLKLYQGLCEVSPVKVSLEAIQGGANGYYDLQNKHIVIKQGMGEEMTLKTLIHEITHASIHEGSSAKFGDEVYACQEFEAESVAYVVSQHLGIDTSSYSFAYLSSWTDNDVTHLEALEKSIETITAQAQITIDKLESSLNKVYSLDAPKNKFEERLSQAKSKPEITTQNNEDKLSQSQTQSSKMTPPLPNH